MNNFLFVGLPYTAVIVMLIASVYRYRTKAFNFSSLSTQILEDKLLYKGILPFHLGIIYLFFGHLTAFLFPTLVFAWNGSTTRLLSLETTAFGFALALFYGIVILIIRRLGNERVSAVTSKMDYVVFLLLVVQIISGLWVAYFNRWGSSWFAAVLTPYLKSIFLFSPDIRALILAPLPVKIHIISAFLIIGIIPFTRLVHFLVYPFGYFYRRYQVVIWNWNRKTIRNSKSMNNGINSKNN